MAKQQTAPKKKSVQVSPEEEARLQAERAAQKNLIDGQQEINKILQKRGINLVVDGNSPIGAPRVIVVPIKK